MTLKKVIKTEHTFDIEDYINTNDYFLFTCKKFSDRPKVGQFSYDKEIGFYLKGEGNVFFIGEIDEIYLIEK